MKLNNNTILITGGSKGIGFEMAKKFLQLNNKVIICGRNESSLKSAKNELKDVYTIKCDISNSNDRKELVETIKKEFPSLNVLVNNAGIQRDVNFNSNCDDLHNLDEISINFEAPIFLIKELLPLIRENNNPCIINVSSQLGFFPMAKMPIYSATKAAMHSFTKSLRHQLKDTVEVIEIIPPAVDTNLNPEGRKKGNFKFDLKTPEYVEDVFEKLKKELVEICYKDNLENINNSTKKDIDSIFEKMNNR
ncbi:SDR family oxidoreductase [Clostridium thermobutyricum]|uniref:SDR family oxidoreductase n=1 Tax=Clostridium thermobutyricum TaxID=29372 RepID=UPI003F51C4B2